VEFVHRGQTVSVTAAREVILCGGAINSPQILNLSGVGNPGDLKTHGIAVRAPLGGVGRNLQDHISAGISYLRKSPGPLHRAMRFDRIAWELGNAYLRGKGIATDLPSGSMAFLKSTPDAKLPDIQLLPLAAPMTAAPWLEPFRARYDDGFGIRAVVLRPESRGHVRLKSADPAASPIIVQNFLAARKDRDTLRAGIRIVRDVGRQEPLQPFVGKELAPLGFTDAELDAHIHATGISVHHPMGTCRMGLPSDPAAVVDPELRVIGVERLRVVDASVMPDLVGGNINAPVMMIAEKAADLIAGRTLLAPAPV